MNTQLSRVPGMLSAVVLLIGFEACAARRGGKSVGNEGPNASVQSVSVHANADRMFTTEQWLENLEFVLASLKSHHAHLHYRITPEEFGAALDASAAFCWVV